MRSIQNATLDAAEKMGSIIGKEAAYAIEQIARELLDVTRRTEQTLTRYETEIIMTQWKVINELDILDLRCMSIY
jgi:hypothetical protein